MNARVALSSEFRAIHTVEYPLCPARPHGHLFRAEMTAEGGMNPKTGRFDLLILPFTSVIAELADEDLNALLPGIFPTPENLAAYIAERIRMHIPGLVAVSVAMDDWTASVSF